MSKKIISLALIMVLWSNYSYAEIGKSVSDFKKSEFAEHYSIKFIKSYMFSYFSEYKGKMNFYFEDSNKRYTIELMADPHGKMIISQALTYPYGDDEALVLQDGALVVGFVRETTGGTIYSDTVLDTINKIVEKTRSYDTEPTTTIIKGYKLQISKTDSATKINITITKET